MKKKLKIKSNKTNEFALFWFQTTKKIIFVELSFWWESRGRKKLSFINSDNLTPREEISCVCKMVHK